MLVDSSLAASLDVRVDGIVATVAVVPAIVTVVLIESAMVAVVQTFGYFEITINTTESYFTLCRCLMH